MIARFGKGTWPPFCEDVREWPTPVGDPCLWCGERIREGDQGGWMTVVRQTGGALWQGNTARASDLEPGLEPEHIECFIRQSIGSVGHLRRHCSCYGGTEGDPPGMTRREAAQAALDLFTHQLELGYLT